MQNSVILLSFVRSGKSDSVLIIKFDQLGDYIIARNFLVRIRHYVPYQSRKIILCANIALKSFIETYDAAAYDEIVWIDRAKLLNEIWARFTTLRQVKMIGAQTAIQFMYGLESFSADCVMRASGARERYGRLITHESPVQRSDGGKLQLGSRFYSPQVNPDRVIFDFYRHRFLFTAVFPGLEPPKDTELVPIPTSIPPVSGSFAIIMPGASDASGNGQLKDSRKSPDISSLREASARSSWEQRQTRQRPWPFSARPPPMSWKIGVEN